MGHVADREGKITQPMVEGIFQLICHKWGKEPGGRKL